MSIIYFLVCLGASILGAISGIGGGVIIKPLLDAMGTMDVSTISFLSGCTVLGMTTMTLYNNYTAGIHPEKKTATHLAIGAALGGMLGKQLFEFAKTASGNAQLTGSIQSFVLAFITLAVLIFTLNKAKIKTYTIQTTTPSIFIGFVLGVLSSFLGIGGGPINLAVLYLFFSLDRKDAAINSIYIIFFSQITSFIQTLFIGVPSFEWHIGLMMVLGGILGGTIGPILSKKLSIKGFDKLYLGMIIAILLISIYNGIHYLLI